MSEQEKIAPVKQKRKRCTKVEKNKYYQAWKQSGVTQSKFCEANNLSLPTFSAWVRPSGSSPEGSPQKAQEIA